MLLDITWKAELKTEIYVFTYFENLCGAIIDAYTFRYYERLAGTINRNCIASLALQNDAFEHVAKFDNFEVNKWCTIPIVGLLSIK